MSASQRLQAGRASPSCRLRCALLAALACVGLATGCTTTKWVTLRTAPHNSLVENLQLGSSSAMRPSPRTMQLLRVYNLADGLDGDYRALLEKFQRITEQEPSADKVYALAELSYIGGVKVERTDRRAAVDLYGAAVLHAYAYLFDDRLAETRNCYDSQFRGACELYNGALESTLRLACEKRELAPGRSKTIQTSAGTWDITCVLRGSAWRPEDFDRFEFVSDYEMKGLKNHYQTRGLGVPLIAVRRSYAGEPAASRYYPGDLSFPVTAFLRPIPGGQGGRAQGLLELYDTLATSETMVGRFRVPLESDLTTPLAYFLSKVPMESMATTGLLEPEKLLVPQAERKTPIMGLYMVQPYEPGKIPVVMVHGLWSSPMTWMEMFNDLRSSTDIRQHYQFWFYLYPTAQPFWLSASQLRHDLAQVRRVVDPEGKEPALDQMVLVGHSMGGLVSRLQTIDSGDDYWRLASRLPLEQVKAEPEVRQKLEEVFRFHPNPSVRRVVTLGTPHHGSTFSNNTTQYLVSKMIRLPSTLVNKRQQLFRDNPELLFDRSILKVDNSIESLAPSSPIFEAMLASQRAPWVKYHNVIGQLPRKWYLGPLGTDTDGVVAVSSARVNDAASELVVPADHMTVHCHPLAVMEVRRILHEHLAELRGQSPPAAEMPPAQTAAGLKMVPLR